MISESMQHVCLASKFLIQLANSPVIPASEIARSEPSRFVLPQVSRRQ